jgi:hypothetical protein
MILPYEKSALVENGNSVSRGLDRAREQILEQLASFNTQRDKIKPVYSSEAAQRRQEGIMDHITQLLRRHKRPKQSVVAVYNQVSMACASMAPATRSTKPIDVDEVTKELVNAARELLRVLGHSALPPNYMFRVFGTMQNRNQFIEHLERMAAITHRKPPRNIDRVKRDCANHAYLLITMCTTEVPTGTQGGTFRTVAGLLHQYTCPTADGKIVDLKTACDQVLKRVKSGQDLEIHRW